MQKKNEKKIVVIIEYIWLSRLSSKKIENNSIRFLNKRAIEQRQWSVYVSKPLARLLPLGNLIFLRPASLP